MFGRMATNCGWAVEYINELDVLTVMRLSEYWAIEPPNNWLLKALTGYKEAGEPVAQDERLFQETVAPAKAFDALPRHIQQAIIERSGLSEQEFHRRRIARRKEQLQNARRSN